jgi:beta-phosphoglucomutase-like phosphatase (HAD superfamily)
MGVAPANCIVFEDSPNGLLAAKSAGMFCVAIQSDVSIVNKLSKADHLIRRFSEITTGQLFELFAVKCVVE